MAYYHKQDLTAEDKARMAEGATQAEHDLDGMLANIAGDQLLGARMVLDWFKRSAELTSPRRLAQILVKKGSA